MGRRNHVLGGVHTGATCWIPLNHARAAVMRPFVKLRWPLVCDSGPHKNSYGRRRPAVSPETRSCGLHSCGNRPPYHHLRWPRSTVCSLARSGAEVLAAKRYSYILHVLNRTGLSTSKGKINLNWLIYMISTNLLWFNALLLKSVPNSATFCTRWRKVTMEH